MKISLFHIAPKAPASSSVRFYEGAIIAANTLEGALRTHPASSQKNRISWGEKEQRWMSHWKDGTRRPYINTTWPDHPSKVKAVLLARETDAVPGVVLAAPNKV